MMTLPDYSHFFVHPLATLSTVMLNVWNLQKHTNWIATHFCSPKKVVPTVFARYNREQLEQLGKYTGKLIVTTDPGIRVWYGMVWWFTRKMAKPVESHHFQGYKHITRLFPIYFPIISRVVPYYIGETWRNHILSVENLLNISKLKKMTGAEFFDDVFASF